jgi:hypothetical protein
MRVQILICDMNHWFTVHLPARLNIDDCIWLDELLPKSDVDALLNKNAQRYMDEIIDSPIYEVQSVDWRKDQDGIYQAAFVVMRR